MNNHEMFKKFFEEVTMRRPYLLRRDRRKLAKGFKAMYKKRLRKEKSNA